MYFLGNTKKNTRNRTKKIGGRPMSKEEIQKARQRMMGFESEGRDEKTRNAERKIREWKKEHYAKKKTIEEAQARIAELDSAHPRANTTYIHRRVPPLSPRTEAKQRYTSLPPEKRESIKKDNRKQITDSRYQVRYGKKDKLLV